METDENKKTKSIHEPRHVPLKHIQMGTQDKR